MSKQQTAAAEANNHCTLQKAIIVGKPAAAVLQHKHAQKYSTSLPQGIS
jgi:hypothetical protein